MRVLITTVSALALVTLTLLVSLTALTIFAAPAPAPAPARAIVTCNCGSPRTFEEMARRRGVPVVEAVAVDKWTGLTSDYHRYGIGWTPMPVVGYQFRVARSWGWGRSTLELEQGHTFCDQHYAIGRRYLIFVSFYDSPPHMSASACVRRYEGADIAAFGSLLGPPDALFALPDPIEVPSSPGLRRRLQTFLVGSFIVYNWLVASRGTGRAVDEWVLSTSSNRGAAIGAAWGVLIAGMLASTVCLIALARRQWRPAARLAAATCLFLVAGLLLPGMVLILSNDWLATAALSWTNAPAAAPPTRHDQR